MRNVLYCFVLGTALLTAPPLLAQPDTLWSAQLTTAGSSVLYGCASISDGFVAVGYGPGSGSDRDMLVAKVSSTGQVLWTRHFGSSRNEEAWGIVELPDGSFFIAGFGIEATYNRNVVILAGVSAAGDSLWWREYASSGQAKARDAVMTSDGNIGVVGYCLGDNGTYSDMWLLKCQPNGDTLWTRKYGGQQSDTGYRLSRLSDDGFAMVGTTASIGGGGDDPWLVITDSSGDLPTEVTFGGPSGDFANACAVNENDEVFVGGRGSTPGGPALVAKCDAGGAILWSYFYEDEPASQVRGLLPQVGGGIMCAGANTTNGWNSWLMGVDASGGIQWSWTLYITDSELNGIVPASSGGAMAYGRAGANGLVLRLGVSSGILGVVRETVTGTPLADVHVTTVGDNREVITDANGQFTLARSPGFYTLVASGACVETDTFGTVEAYADSTVQVEWDLGVPDYSSAQSSINVTVHNHVPYAHPLQLRNAGSGAMNFQIIPQTILPPSNWLDVSPSEGVVPAGDSVSVNVIITVDTTDNGVFDLFGYLHMHTNSCPDTVEHMPVMVVVLEAGDNDLLLPASFDLEAYPNPFNPVTTLELSLPRETFVNLTVFDITGRAVANLLDKNVQAGTHRISFNASDLSSGVYFACFRAGQRIFTQKLLLMK